MTYDLLVAEDDGDQDHERNVKLATGSVYLAAVETASPFLLFNLRLLLMAIILDVFYCHCFHDDDGTQF